MDFQSWLPINALFAWDVPALKLFLPRFFVEISILMNVLAFQFKGRRKIITCLVISCLCITAHFYLIGVMTASYLVALKLFMLVTAYFTSSKKAMAFFIVSVIGITAATFENSLSLLSGAGELLAAVGTFCRRDKHLRQLLLLSTLIWLVHNVLAGSEVVYKDLLVISSNLIAYSRFYRLSKQHNDEDEDDTTELLDGQEDNILNFVVEEPSKHPHHPQS